jgi:hypothetical protein
MIIQHWHETAEPAVRLSPEDYEHRAQVVLLRSKSYRFSLHGLHPDERRTGKTAKLIDLYARLSYANL